MGFIEILEAVLIGIIQGITEWLPVSSTGHMILFDELVHLDISDAFREMFLVVIQLGSILAVLVLYFQKLYPFAKSKSSAEKKATISLWCKVVVGAIPAGIAGVLFNDWFEEKFYNFFVVAIALIVYGVAFIVIERVVKKKGIRPKKETVYDLTYADALYIGCFQILSLIPGTSRSGSTIIGGISKGVSRVAASEFSFFMALPVMAGASLLKILKFFYNGNSFTSAEVLTLIIGVTVAFIVSLAAIKFLIDFVKRHSFECFGWYRIALGIIVLIFFLKR